MAWGVKENPEVFREKGLKLEMGFEGKAEKMILE